MHVAILPTEIVCPECGTFIRSAVTFVPTKELCAGCASLATTHRYTVVADSRDGIFDVFDALVAQGLAPSEPARRGSGGEWSLVVAGSFDDLSGRVCNATFAECSIWPVDSSRWPAR